VIARLALLALLICAPQIAAHAQQLDIQPGTETRADAVALARAGRYEEAIEMFSHLRIESPNDQQLLQDFITTLSWAGLDDRALALAGDLDADAAPRYVLHAIAKSSRNTGDFDAAISWYERAIASDPTDADAHIGLALTLTDAGRYNDARAALDAVPTGRRYDTDVALATAYAQVQAGDLLAALRTYDAILASDPNDVDTLRGKALVLRELLLPQPALELARAHPGILTDEEIERLEVDDLAVKLRLAAKTIYPVESDGELLDETIAEIDDHLASRTESDAELALRFDRIVALAERNDSQQAIAAFEEIEAEGVTIPPYVLGSAGRAYLQQEQPKRAVELLRPAAAADPSDIELQFALIYAYLDLDDYASAMTLAQSLIAAEPMLLTATDSPIVKGNEKRMRAEVVAAIADASVYQLEAAQKRLESLLDGAPNNNDVRHELANVYRWRGWLDRSLFEYDQVLTVDEDLLHAKVGRTYTQLDAQQFEEADKAITELNEHQASEPVVEQLTQTWQAHNRSELLIEAQTGESTGTTFGTNQYSIDTRWFTRPIRYNYRAILHLHKAFAEFPEGDAERQRVGVGAEYRSNRWAATGEILGDRDRGGQIGFAGELGWRMSDLWHLSGDLEIDGNQNQVRAHEAGVEQNLIGLSATYAPNEAASATAGWQARHLSDGNRGMTLYGDLRRRAMTRPRTRLDLLAEVATSINDDQNVPYFSPERDLSYLVGAEHEWRIRRRYERYFSQLASIHVGRYDQAGFSAGNIWRASYMLSFELSRNLLIRAGAQRSRMFYDGSAEHETTLLATIEARL
jgi:biofilm PGA synthesis protein PgaA